MGISNKKQQIKVYYYPSPSRGGYPNPYSYHYKEAIEKEYNLINRENKCAKILGWDFFKNSFKADLYIINWLESICFLRLGWLQYIFACLGLWIIKKRRKKIVWMFHNIHPHQGDNQQSQKIQYKLFCQASLIMTHSKEAMEYAQKHTNKKVIFINHPISPITFKKINIDIPSFDILIWGAILPYKGIAEFLEIKQIQQSSITIRILGSCKNPVLSNKINNCCNEHILFENRKATFDEISAYINKSKYVLFPYIGNCVSSSGALIDTLVLGGTPIGPNVGAFKDLSEKGLCLTYENKTDLLNLLTSHNTINNSEKNKFITENSWSNLIKVLQHNL